MADVAILMWRSFMMENPSFATYPINHASCSEILHIPYPQNVRREILRFDDIRSMAIGGVCSVRPNKYHLGASVALFLLTTTYVGMIVTVVVDEPVMTSSSSFIDGSIVTPCLPKTPESQREVVINNLFNIIIATTQTGISFVADGLLIYRCVLLWPRHLGRWIGMLLGVLLLAETALNSTQAYFAAKVYFLIRGETPQNTRILQQVLFGMSGTIERVNTAADFLSLAVNLITTILIASRIWFMARQLEKTLGKKAGRGIWSFDINITASQFMLNPHQQYLSICYVNQMLIVIAPTLIIVRVGMGRGFDSVVETLHQHHASQEVRDIHTRSIQFAEHRTTATDVSHLGPLRAIAQATVLESDGDAYSTHSSGSLEQAASTKIEKREVDSSVI
ncbi:hypothetical protein DENSPDRAFT_853212 [Dentipellis sp. KUC8613]|nr:hypothetical protein DENSPDRAFT_853212 [Dentipellis sp. KUC8613]